eukprot:2061120-Rhodomonas_salina.1
MSKCACGSAADLVPRSLVALTVRNQPSPSISITERPAKLGEQSTTHSAGRLSAEWPRRAASPSSCRALHFRLASVSPQALSRHTRPALRCPGRALTAKRARHVADDGKEADILSAIRRLQTP